MKPKKSSFTGWKEVFSFTTQTQAGNKSFQFTTFLIAIGIFVVALLVTLSSGNSKKEEQGENSFQNVTEANIPSSPLTVHLFNESDLNFSDFQLPWEVQIVSSLEPEKSLESFANSLGKADANSLLLSIKKEGSAYTLQAVFPYNSPLSDSEKNQVTEMITATFKQYQLLLAGLDASAVEELSTPMVSQTVKIGEESKSMGEILLNMLAPLILTFVLYIMLLLYGQTIAKTLVTEKSSKVLETLLTSVRPYAVVTGKILSMTFLAIVQLALWIGGGVLGYVVGDMINRSNHPNYISPVQTLFTLLRENSEGLAFSPLAIFLGIVILVVGFLFYCTLAGLCGAMINKMEELGNGMAIFQIPVIASFLLAYFARLNGNTGLIRLARFLPFSAPFALPAELIIGDATLTEGLLSLGILLASFLVVIIITSKIYKGLILISGTKVTSKTVLQLLKTK